MTVVWLDGRPSLDRGLLGGKALGLNTMLGLGLPVPPAFTVTTRACRDYHHGGRRMPAALEAELWAGIGRLERATGRRFGSAEHPLRVSVRSGAAHSMPGMLDTVLDLGGADPTQARGRLTAAVAAVFDSWCSPRAQIYRREHAIPDDGGTAVTVQAMVSGDTDDESGTGVLFTCNPMTGRPEPYGEWLPRARGDDLVAGRRTPQPVDLLARHLPRAHTQLLAAGRSLEQVARWPQDIEFTVERGRLWLLQTRDAQCAPVAAVRIAVTLWRAGLIDVSHALQRVGPRRLAELGRHRSATPAAGVPLCRGVPASPGVASGTVVTDPEHARRRADAGHDIVLARPRTDPGDVPAMFAARAVLTEVGGATSHAAIVCRELNLPCVVGCGPGTLTPLQGRQVTVDGDTGAIFPGMLPGPRTGDETDPDVALFRTWAHHAPETVADKEADA
ncbi:pyruvate phosphate dikinase [Amycolatopsis sulphurea]|uniref:Pyruvate phosphate dikinase n=1 Tax=Amycolatopsis sulphurea TaxID=76022 RepID=A0A2A9FAC2_9PSEU|nr:PEP/pyruvate-binding domain-containing protein [Amycolatopsis sulphurea]PFG47903.1 pyruvate phosphate dikinase [Amycolatopsis sulphurea]